MNELYQNKKAFSKLIEKHQTIIHKITLVYTNGTENRKDLFQEICLQLWKSYPSFGKHAKISTWIYRVALNTAISNVRKNRKEPSFDQLNDFDIVADYVSTDMENVKLLYHAISKLNWIDKAIILLWLEEKSYEDIAVIMGTSKTNVSVKLVRIKRKLEELVGIIEKQES